MRITKIRIQNYRSIENISLEFPQYYTAICGKNDAGKSNLIRVLRTVFGRTERVFWTPEEGVQIENDFPKWKEQEKDGTNRFIQFDFSLSIDKDSDEGLFRFINDYVQFPGLDAQGVKTLGLDFMVRYGKESSPKVGVMVSGNSVEELKSQEILKKIESSSGVLFHDSTEFFHPYKFFESTALFKEMSQAESKEVGDAKAKLGKALSKVAKRNQQDLTAVLGRLKEKYKIGIKVQASDTNEIPYNLTLGTQSADVDLERWGSGTQNRTRILMTLFKAKKVRESATSAEKVTPVIVVEEPENYLHPSAQAEFGNVLRDLAEELGIQVIVTSHSPYMLSLSEPQANILLHREIHRGQAKQTLRADTAGKQWMEPFTLALGISGEEISPWRDVLFSKLDSVLLVEGELDREYLELLRQSDHEQNRLCLNGEIVSYGGKDALKQRQLISFMKSRFKRFIVTYDLDANDEISRALVSVGLEKGKDFVAIGREQDGKKCIEGLLPESTWQVVYTSNVDLVQKSMSSDKDAARSARSSLKKLALEEFRKSAKPKTDDYKHFYALTKQLNKMCS